MSQRFRLNAFKRVDLPTYYNNLQFEICFEVLIWLILTLSDFGLKILKMKKFYKIT
jgi:hypothetical protein